MFFPLPPFYGRRLKAAFPFLALFCAANLCSFYFYSAKMVNAREGRVARH